MANEMRDRLVELLKKADENTELKCITDYKDAIQSRSRAEVKGNEGWK